MTPDPNPAGATLPQRQNPIPRPEQGKDIFGNQNQSLISLAVKCRLIPPEAEGGLLDQLALRRKAQPDYSALELFEETKAISRENIDFLLAVRDHLEMKMLDKKFGELGIANHFVSPEHVKKALDIQSAIFKETNQSKLIGDILLENNEISQADKSAILLTQDRIKDELLFEALNDIAASEIEKLSLNMRFGAIAVKKDLISLAQLNQALAIQESEVKAGQPRRYLGQILKDRFSLKDQDLDRVLKIQKELEKKRLALEKALERYNSEALVNKRLAKTFDYRFSKNKLAAYLGRARESFEDFKASDLKRWLASVGITFGLRPDKEIQDFVNRSAPGAEICVAQGVAPTPGQDGRIEFYVDTANKNEEADPESPALVRKGDALARRIPASPGKPGKDVSGFSLAPAEPRQALLNCGEGVMRDNDLFIAETDGMAVLYQDRTLFVRPGQIQIPTRYHTGAIDQDLGDTYAKVNLRVEGDILFNGKVICQGLEVSGSVLGQVAAAGDVVVKGQIGDLSLDDEAPQKPAEIKAQGDIKASKAIGNALIITAKSLVAPNSDLRGATVQAFEDITVKNILHSGETPSVIQAGKVQNLRSDRIDSQIRAKTRELEALTADQERKALDAWYQTKIGAKETYLAQQEFLKFVLALIKVRDLDHLTDLDEKIAAARKTPATWPDLPACPEEDTQEFKSFTLSFLAQARQMDPVRLEAFAGEQAEIKYGMYRAAVNAARRYTKEYEARKAVIQETIQSRQNEIEALETAIKKLVIQKDSLGQPLRPPPVPPAIRVKNQVARGTVIKGRVAKLVVDQDIFGVKFTEAPKTSDTPPQILIQGFYD